MRWRRQGEQPARDAAPQPARAAPEAGHPLEPATRGRMEARLGHDFGNVRIHHRAEEAKALHARAFAVGEDVTFAPGQYAPGTAAGDRLLAHELGHVVDHRGGAPLGAYRAPEGEQIPAGPERPLAPPRPRMPRFGLDSLTLGLGTLDGFAFRGSDLTERHRERIGEIVSRLVALMGRMPGGRVTVTGHTDLAGGEQVNLDLGRKRAVAVAAALAAAGIPRALIDVDSAGESAPLVEAQGEEPRNRRVEIRFAGAPLGGEEPRLRLGPPEPGPTIRFTPTQPVAPGRTPVTPQPAQGDRGKPEQETRPGSLTDLAKAVAALPDVKRLIEAAEARGEKDLGRLSTSDKVVLGTVTGSIAAGVVAGIASDPATRKSVLDFADGKEIPVPWLPGVSVVPHTKGGGIGGGVRFDIVKILGGGKK
jgi:outer membrane protein OmpA-like peptidoglycan-associated protein